jgi:hypothetical protein
LATESPSEHQDSGIAFTPEQLEGLRKLASRNCAISAATYQQAQMQPWHRECRIQIGGDPIMLDCTA